ncbi:MAG: uroporphyrinogen decarboxylase family protein [Melioribacteraceae bacterium]|nr:uroporphyrinogen decarboxylase family protein [Melioribacteraceae bacterium]
MIDFKNRMLSVIRGETPDGLLFVPRLDIWYNYNKAHNTLPEGYENLSLSEVVSKLGVGFHSVVPDFIHSAPVESIYHRALGFYNNPDFPYSVDFSSVDFDVTQSNDELKVIYHTGHGDLTTRCSYGEELFNSGNSIPEVIEHAVKKREDYNALAEILSNVRIQPTPDNYKKYNERIGNAGIAVAFTSLACGPMQHIMRDLVKYEDFCLDLYDDQSTFSGCIEPLAELYDKILDSTLLANAEVVLFGANYDETITYPPFFDEYITPWLNKAYNRLHSAGKFLLTHTDGENEGLLPSFTNCLFDIADSVCPAPMTKLSLQDYREFFGRRTTIWGGIPSNILLKDCCSFENFKNFVKNVIDSCKPYDHLVLSIADTTPPDADFGRILYLAEECANTFNR